MPTRSRATDARWLPNYVKAFGPFGGVNLLRQVAALDRADAAEPAGVAVPGLGRVWLRGRQRDHAIFQQVWVKREYDLAAAAPRHWPLLWSAYEATVAAGRRPLIVDAGAHVGLSVLWWKRLFPRAHVVAVEPSSANLAVLRQNLTGLDDVTVLQAALAGTEGRLRLESASAEGSATRVAADGVGEEVPAVSMNRILSDAGPADLLLAKIDVEGGEAGIFAGPDLNWLDRARALAVETHDWLWPGRGTSRSLWAALAVRPFDVIASGENLLLFRTAEQ